ncbi:MAG: VWA domain-containing protein [Planctomycetota bacterium]
MTLLEHFLRPDVLPWLLAVPVVGTVLILLGSRRQEHLGGLAGERLAQRVTGADLLRRRLRALSLAAGLLLAIVALAEPVFGEDETSLRPRGADIVVCLDVSRSMLARDVAPSRLDFAREALSRLAERVEGDRLALVVFAGESRLLVPLTQDRRSFLSLARSADPLTVERGGTDLGAALRTAVGALGGRGEGEAAIVVVTDGEDHEGEGLAAAERCAALGIPVHAVGIGSERGSKITEASEKGETFQRDRQGREIVSMLDLDSLRAMASASGGTALAADGDTDALATLHESEVMPRVRAAHETERRSRRTPRFQWALAAALLFWLLIPCLQDRRPA